MVFLTVAFITNTVRVLKCNFSVSAHVRDKVNCGFFASRAFFLATVKLTKPPINYQSRVPRNPSSTKSEFVFFVPRQLSNNLVQFKFHSRTKKAAH